MGMGATGYRDGMGALAKFLAGLPRVLQAPPEVIELLPLAVFACDASGRLLWSNRSAAELWQSAGSPGQLCDFKLYLAGEGKGLETATARVLRIPTAILGAAGMAERRDGTRLPVVAHVHPVENEGGELIGVITCCLDTSTVAAQALREQNQRLAVTYEHATVGIAEIDAEGRRMRVNATACAVTGRSREELLGGNVFDTVHPEDREEDLRQYRRLVAGDIDRYSIEKRIVRKDGAAIWASVMCSAVRDDGEFLYAVRIFQDITDAKRAAQALAESEQRLAATYEHAGIAISEVDERGQLLRVNEAACAITGYSREELLGLTIFDVTHPDDRDADVESFEQQTIDAGKRYAVEKRLIRKDGRIIWVSVTSSTVRDRAGRFLYGIRVMRDITSRLRAQEALAASERRFRELLEGLPAAVYTTDAAGRITFYNQAAVELAGVPPEIGRSDEQWITRRLYQPDGAPLPREECPMVIALRENRPVRGVEALLERPDGTRAPFIPYPTPLRDEGDELIGAVNMLVDISERKQAEANQKVLLDELSHRVKNNMQMLHSLLRAAQRETQSAEARAVLADAGQRVGAMAAAQQVLYEAGNAVSYNAKDFLEGVCGGTKQVFTGNIDIVISHCAPERLSNDTAMPLALILNELLTNAAKYGVNGRDEGSIRVHLTKELDSFELVVEDDGPGFELGDVNKRSSGLGLVSGLARQLGGALKVERAPGARCRVQFFDRASVH
jgi:PAS domain S-box-containing protein